MMPDFHLISLWPGTLCWLKTSNKYSNKYGFINHKVYAWSGKKNLQMVKYEELETTQVLKTVNSHSEIFYTSKQK